MVCDIIAVVVDNHYIGVYFIDRNPKYFDRILDYLRTGEFVWKGLDELGREKLEKDLDYYQIPIIADVPGEGKEMLTSNVRVIIVYLCWL